MPAVEPVSEPVTETPTISAEPTFEMPSIEPVNTETFEMPAVQPIQTENKQEQ